MTTPMPPFAPTPTGLHLRLRVTLNAATDRIDGPGTLADGTSVLHLRVRAVPEGSRANAAVLALLAKQAVGWVVPPARGRVHPPSAVDGG